MTTEDELNGRIRNYLCRVSKVDPGHDNQGVYEDEIELAAVSRIQDQ